MSHRRHNKASALHHRTERERCAQIAERIAQEHANGHDEWDEAAEHTALRIAREIRNGAPS